MEIVSTGGTARELAGAGIATREIEDFTGFPEMMDGRVKTLHPRLYAGLLAKRDNDDHLRRGVEQQHRAGRSGLCEPVPVRADRRARRRRRAGDRREHRHRRPDDDPRSRQEQRVRRRGRRPGRLRASCWRSCATPTGACRSTRENAWRRRPSRARLATTRRSPRGSRSAPTTAFRRRGTTPTRRSQTCATARTRISGRPSTRASARPRTCSTACDQLHGKELSFNNLLDLSSARELVEDFDGPACAIVKHNNPCGAAVADERAGCLRTRLRVRPAERLRRRDRRQPAHRPAPAPQELSKQFIEVLLAPGFEPDALELLSEKKNVRLLELAHWPPPAHEVEAQAGHRRPARADARRRLRDARADARADRARRRASASGQTCCSPGRSAATCAPTRSCSPPRRRDDRHRRRADEPGRRRAHRHREGAGLPAEAARRLGARLRRLLPVRRRTRAGDRRGRQRRSCSPADRCATRMSSPPRSRPASRWSRPACATSATEPPQPAPRRSGRSPPAGRACRLSAARRSYCRTCPIGYVDTSPARGLKNRLTCEYRNHDRRTSMRFRNRRGALRRRRHRSDALTRRPRASRHRGFGRGRGRLRRLRRVWRVRSRRLGGGRGRGRKARRGDIRTAALLLLAEEPRNGYQIMQEVEERSDGVWRPSPGSVYPALRSSRTRA